jgi:hypothetical protein
MNDSTLRTLAAEMIRTAAARRKIPISPANVEQLVPQCVERHFATLMAQAIVQHPAAGKDPSP